MSTSNLPTDNAADSAPLLVVGPSWVGDMVMAQCLFTTLKKQHPQRPIDVLAPAWSRPLLERMPEVRRAIDLPFGHGEFKLGERRRLGLRLRAEHYGQAILLPNSLKSALVPWFAKIPQRTGWLGEKRYGLLNDWRKLDKEAFPLMVQRFVALAHPPGTSATPLHEIPWPRLQVESASVSSALQAFDITAPKGRVLALCPGAEFGPAKRWPEQHYGEVARELLDRGYQVWLFGSAKDQPVTSQVDRIAGGGCVDLAGKTTLAQAIDLMSLADVVISNDSGLMHVAAALGKKIAVPYGSSSPSFTPPLAEHVQILSLHLSCSPCFKRECPLGHLNCLKQLLPERMLTAVNELERT